MLEVKPHHRLDHKPSDLVGLLTKRGGAVNVHVGSTRDRNSLRRTLSMLLGNTFRKINSYINHMHVQMMCNFCANCTWTGRARHRAISIGRSFLRFRASLVKYIWGH